MKAKQGDFKILTPPQKGGGDGKGGTPPPPPKNTESWPPDDQDQKKGTPLNPQFVLLLKNKLEQSSSKTTLTNNEIQRFQSLFDISYIRI